MCLFGELVVNTVRSTLKCMYTGMRTHVCADVCICYLKYECVSKWFECLAWEFTKCVFVCVGLFVVGLVVLERQYAMQLYRKIYLIHNTSHNIRRILYDI